MRGATTRDGSADHERTGAAALRWLARLVLLTERQLAIMVGRDEWDTRTVLRELRGRGLVASVIVDSPEFREALRLYHLTHAGVVVLVDQADLESDVLPDVASVVRAELLAHLARVETAVGVADAVTMVANDLRRPAGDCRSAAIVLEDAGSTGWAPHRGWPIARMPQVEAWARLRAGSLSATVHLAWDRVGAPRAHRRARVAAWYRADENRAATRRIVLPPVLVICPDESAMAEWSALIDESAARRGRSLLSAALTTVSMFTTHGPLERIWRRPGDHDAIGLLDLLVWEGATSPWARSADHATSHLPRRGDRREVGRAVGRTDWRLHQFRLQGTSDDHCPVAERRAALALGLSATQKTLLGWVTRHPLLPVGHLATYLALPERVVAQLLGGLEHRHLVIGDTTPGFRNDHGPRYVLTQRGADYLAARDGVPLHRYLREGTIAAEGKSRDGRSGEPASVMQGDVRLLDLRRRPAHTIGVQDFALAFTREATRQRTYGRDHRMLAWLNPVEGQVWFRHAGTAGHVWPDARFRYRVEGVVYDLLLEWDCGLVRRRDYARKFAAYAAYAAVGGLDAAGTQWLVIVTTGEAASQVRAELTAAARRAPNLAARTIILIQGMYPDSWFDLVRGDSQGCPCRSERAHGQRAATQR